MNSGFTRQGRGRDGSIGGYHHAGFARFWEGIVEDTEQMLGQGCRFDQHFFAQTIGGRLHLHTVLFFKMAPQLEDCSCNIKLMDKRGAEKIAVRE